MTKNPEPDARRISLSRTINASPETVWSVFTQSELFSAWMAGEVTVDLDRKELRGEFGGSHVVRGRFLSLDQDARELSVTWRAGAARTEDSEAAARDAPILSLSVLKAANGASLVKLVHAGHDPALADAQRSGWRFQLSRLAYFANRIDLEAALQRVLPLWEDAWNEARADKRIRILGRCCDPDTRFSDMWTETKGIDELALHIGNCHAYMPGQRLQLAAKAAICRGKALVGWRRSGPELASQSGHNLMTVSPSGRICEVLGFSEGE